MNASTLIRRKVKELGYKAQFKSVNLTDLSREWVVKLAINGLPTMFFDGIPPEHQAIVNWKNSQEFADLKAQFELENECRLIV